MSTTNPQQIADIAALDQGKSLSEKIGAIERPQTPAQRFVRWLTNSSITFIVVVIALLWSIPTFGLFISSFRPVTLINTSGWWTGLLPSWHFTLENYQAVILQQGLGQAFLNSLIIAIPGTLFPMLIGAFAAYAFAWMKFPGVTGSFSAW